MTPSSCRFSLVLLSLATVMVSSSCSLFDPAPNHRLVEPEAVVPRGFLYNPDPTYNEWMDTPLRVYYHEVSIDRVFSEKPFADFHYELHDIPAEMDLVTLDSVGQTRKQLLWAISHDYNLKMTLLMTPGGRPSKVVIRWRGDGMSESGIIKRPETKRAEIAPAETAPLTETAPLK